MSLKRSHIQVSHTAQAPAASVKRSKHGFDSLGLSNHPTTLADLLPQTQDQAQTSPAMGAYDFSEFAATHPHVSETQEAPGDPFFEYLDNGSDFSPSSVQTQPQQPQHFNHHPYQNVQHVQHFQQSHHHQQAQPAIVGSAASSTVGSAAASPTQAIVPCAPIATHGHSGGRPTPAYPTVRFPQLQQQVALPPSIARPALPQGAVPSTTDGTQNAKNENVPVASDNQSPKDSQQVQVEQTDGEAKRSGRDGTSSDTTAVEDSESSRRAADRAARNRESSRRAREKAKGRLKALENDNLQLHELTRRQRLQIDSLTLQLQQFQRGACNMCGYGLSSISSAAHGQTYNQEQQSSILPHRQ